MLRLLLSSFCHSYMCDCCIRVYLLCFVIQPHFLKHFTQIFRGLDGLPLPTTPSTCAGQLNFKKCSTAASYSPQRDSTCTKWWSHQWMSVHLKYTEQQTRAKKIQGNIEASQGPQGIHLPYLADKGEALANACRKLWLPEPTPHLLK